MMRTIQRALGILLAALAVSGAVAPRAVAGAETTASESAAADFVLPEDFFPIMSWEVLLEQDFFADPEAGLKSLAECGFTVAAFVKPHHLPECERLGLKAILRDERPGKDWKNLSDAQITSYVKRMVDSTSQSQAVIGYCLKDEPGAGQFPNLEKAVAAVRTLAPGKLGYINLYPDYAIIGAADISQLQAKSYADYLERYASEVKPQVISYDNYRVLFSNDLRTTAAESYYRNLLEVRRVAQKHNLPFWNIVSSNQIRPYTTIPTPANLLFQAYSTLAAGGKGVTWFTYYARRYGYPPIDGERRKTTTWTYLKMVNEQLKVVGPVMMKLESTGVYFTKPLPFESLPSPPAAAVFRIEADSPLMVGQFRGGENDQYAMLVNLNLDRSVKCRISPEDSRSTAVLQLSPADASWLPIESDNSLWVAPGQGVLLKPFETDVTTAGNGRGQ